MKLRDIVLGSSVALSSLMMTGCSSYTPGPLYRVDKEGKMLPLGTPYTEEERITIENSRKRQEEADKGHHVH